MTKEYLKEQIKDLKEQIARNNERDNANILLITGFKNIALGLNSIASFLEKEQNRFSNTEDLDEKLMEYENQLNK